MIQLHRHLQEPVVLLLAMETVKKKMSDEMVTKVVGIDNLEDVAVVVVKVNVVGDMIGMDRTVQEDQLQKYDAEVDNT